MIRKLFKCAFAAALTLAALPVVAATVVLSGTSGSSCTYSAVAFAADGTMTVTCSGGGGGGPSNQTISFGTAPSISAVGGTGSVSAAATSGLPVTLSSQTSSVCTISGNTVTAVALGSCTIAANQAGNGSFNPAAQVTQSFTIGSGGANYTCNDTTTYEYELPGFIPAGAGTTHLIPASANALPVGSFHFNIDPNDAIGHVYSTNYQSQISGSYGYKDSAISKCKGDFTGKGIDAGTACYINGIAPTQGIRFAIGAPSAGVLCVLDKNGGPYYLNVRGQILGQSEGIVLGINN